jgi:hypothetical protein
MSGGRCSGQSSGASPERLMASYIRHSGIKYATERQKCAERNITLDGSLPSAPLTRKGGGNSISHPCLRTSAISTSMRYNTTPSALTKFHGDSAKSTSKSSTMIGNGRRHSWPDSWGKGSVTDPPAHSRCLNLSSMNRTHISHHSLPGLFSKRDLTYQDLLTLPLTWRIWNNIFGPRPL